MFKLLSNLIEQLSEQRKTTNPANGLPMIDDMHDINGNIFGFNNQSSFESSSFETTSHTSFD